VRKDLERESVTQRICKCRVFKTEGHAMRLSGSDTRLLDVSQLLIETELKAVILKGKKGKSECPTASHAEKSKTWKSDNF
jgi:hypothetical protein